MLVTLPILLPLLSAAMCLIAWGRVRVQNIIMVACTAGMAINGVILLAHVLQNGPVVANISGWDAPFGIIMAGDVLSAIMTVITGVIGLAIAVYSIGGTTEARAANGHAPLVLTMIAAVAGAFVAGDIFNLYVWFELMLLSSFVLLTLGGERAQLEGAIKYVTLNLLSSMIFLAGIGLLYASTGSLNMADLAGRLDAMDNPTKATALAAPLLIAFGIKAAVFPLFFWLPASYHTPPPVVSALFAGLLTKVGVYSLIRVTTLIFDQEQAIIADSIIVVAGLTMLSGVLGAVSQDDFRRILSFHIVSQIGYMLMGLGIALSVDARGGSDADVAALAMGGAVFYIVHHIIVKTNLFLIAGVVVAERGTSELKRLGGLVTTHPVLSGLFLFSSLSLAGIPILSGFWAKLVLVKAGLEAGAFGIVAVSLVVSILTIFSMIKIWTNAFWGSPPEDAPEPSANWRQLGPIFGLAAITLAVSLGAPAVYKLAMRTGNDLLTPSIYIDAVLPPNLEAKLDEAEAKLTDDDGPAEDSDASSDQPQELMP